MVNIVLKYLFVMCGIWSLFSDKSSALTTLLYFAVAALFSIATSLDTIAFKDERNLRNLLGVLKHE